MQTRIRWNELNFADLVFMTIAVVVLLGFLAAVKVRYINREKENKRILEKEILSELQSIRLPAALDYRLEVALVFPKAQPNALQNKRVVERLVADLKVKKGIEVTNCFVQYEHRGDDYFPVLHAEVK